MVDVSVIVPVYNAEKYIADTVTSLITYKGKNVEYILVNDGSRDSSGELCDWYAKKDQRIKVLHKANGGASSARNLGLEIAQGNYIYFQDADDPIIEGVFSRGIDFCRSLEYDWVVFDYSVEKSDGLHKGCAKLKDNFEFSCKDIQVAEEIFCTSEWNGVCGKFYCHELLKQIDLRFEENMVYAEDLVFNINFFLKVKKGYYFNEKILIYKLNEGSVMNSFHYKRLDDTVRLLETMVLSSSAVSAELKLYEGMFERIKHTVEYAYILGDERKKRYIEAFLDEPIVQQILKRQDRESEKLCTRLWRMSVANRCYPVVFFMLRVYQLLYKKRWER